MMANLLCVPKGVIGERWRERTGNRPEEVQPVQVKASQITSGQINLMAPLQGLLLKERGLLMAETLDFDFNVCRNLLKGAEGQNSSARWMEKAIKEARRVSRAKNDSFFLCVVPRPQV